VLRLQELVFSWAARVATMLPRPGLVWRDSGGTSADGWKASTRWPSETCCQKSFATIELSFRFFRVTFWDG